MADDIAKLRAALSSSWDDNTPIPPMTQSVNPLDIVKAAYQNMPGAGVAQAGVAMGSDMLGGLLGNIYGVGKQIATGQLGTPQGTQYAFNEAQKLANQMHYTPPTQAGRDIYEGINNLPQVVTGSHMGVGPLPELWNTRMRLTPDDLRVLGKTATEDFRNFGSDYANAKAGIYREYPTAGSRAAGATETFGQAIKPLAETINNQVMETGGIRMPMGMPDIPVANFAVKPKGGNWPTNLGSTLPLKEQGGFGEHLSKVQYDDPIAVFEAQLKKHFPRGIDNRQLLRDWEDFLDKYALSKDPDYHNYVSKDNPTVKQLTKEAADAFAEAYNAGAIGNENIEPTDKKIYTASEIEQTLPAYNAWVMGPYQKYITNQMGTGLATDPLLQAVNESGMPPSEIFGIRPIDQFNEGRANRMREDFQDKLFGYANTPEKQTAIQNSVIGKETATTPEGIEYEKSIDASLYPRGTYAFDSDKGFPVVSKLPYNTLITDMLHDPDEATGFGQIRKQVFQDLLAGNLDPAKMSNVTPATATRQMIKDKMAEFKEAQLSKKGAAEWIPKRAAMLPTDMEFPDGSKMAIITPEMAKTDESMTARDLGQITIDLNQCVGAGCHGTQDYPGHGPYLVPHTGKPPRGKVEYDKYGYLRRLKAGEIEIASLKDPNGVSQATIELRLKKLGLRDKEDLIYDWLSLNNPEAKTEYNSNLRNFGQEEAVRNAIQLYPELKELIEQKTKKSIEQIKGANNGDVDVDYVPQIIEWLNKNAPNLTDVRELSHLKNVHDLDNHYNSIGKMADERPHWYSPTVENFFEKAESEKLLPRFFTTDQFGDLATEYGVDLSAEPPKKLSDWDKQTLREEVYSVLIKDPESLYLQDNLKDDYVQNLDILFGDRKPEGQVPLDIHRKLADMLLDHNGKYRDQLVSALGQLADKGPNGWVNNFTEPQISNMLNIMAGWFERHPMEKLPSNSDFEKAIAKHPDPFNEITVPESPWHPSESDLVSAVRGMEPENAGGFDRPSPRRIASLQHAMERFFNNQPINITVDEAGDYRILMGNPRPEAQLPRDIHESLVESFLNQDDERHASNIRYIISTLQGPGYFVSMPELTTPQLENILNMAISWTERYPLREQ